MTTRILNWVAFLVIIVILIEEFRVNYYYRIWNHPDSLILAAALAELPAGNGKEIVDAVGSDPEWLSGHFLFSVRGLNNSVRMTNLVRGPFDEITTEVGYGGANRFWNTDAWEVAARYQFKNLVKWKPEYAQILSILREEPAVQRSKRLYTGAYSVTVALFGVDEAVQRIQRHERELKEALLDPSITDTNWIEFERVNTKETIEQRNNDIVNMIGSLRQAFFELYGKGGIPEPTVQRLMAIGDHPTR